MPSDETMGHDPFRIAAAWAGRVGGPVLAGVTLWLLARPAAGLHWEGRATAALVVLMAVWWMTEAIALPVTSLLPIVVLPVLGVLPLHDAAAPYAHPTIFLFMGGFMIALAIEHWGLHRRIALMTVLAVGTEATRLVAGFMIATALLSMWISNTATTVMMLPIGLSVIGMLAGHRDGHPTPAATEGTAGDGSAPGTPHPDRARLGPCLLLGIAYAANIGGVGTLVGTPPNVLLAGFVKTQYGIDIGFGRWMLFGVPLVILFVSIAWLVLTRMVFRLGGGHLAGSADLIREELKRLGPIGRGERTVLIVFVATAAAWAVREPLTVWSGLAGWWPGVRNINDTTIAVAAAILLFLIPIDSRRGIFALDWETAQRLPWGVLLLFGGGLSLAKAVSTSGLAAWVGDQMSAIASWPVAAMVVATTVLVILLTEVTSNTATTTTFLPILGGVAMGIGAAPLLLLVPATLAASFAFMLPVATPPNALVFGSGQITMGQMIRAGMWLNVVGAVLIPLLLYTVGAWLLPLGL